MAAPIIAGEAARQEAIHRLGLDSDVVDVGLDELTQLAAHICEAPIALITVLEASRQRIVAWAGTNIGEIGRDEAFCGHTIAGDEMLVVPDATVDPRFAALELVVGPLHVRFYAGVPLRTSDGQAVGTLCVLDRRPRELTAAQRLALRVLARNVTLQLEARAAQLADRERAAQLLQLDAWFDDTPVGLHSIDGTATFRRINPTALRWLGYPRDEIVDRRTLFDLLQPQDVAWVREVFEAGVRRGRIERLDVDLVRRDGTLLPVTIDDVFVRDAAERVVGSRSVMVVRGGGERTAEIPIVTDAVARQLTAVLESISDAFVALDRDFVYTYVNRRAAALFGRAPGELVGRHIWTEFPEGVGQPFYHAYHRARAERIPLQIEARYEPWNRWFENRIYPSPDGGLAIFFTEITERVTRTGQLRELSARLIQVREEEAARLAREIHDGLGQLLTVLKLDVAWLRARGAGDPAIAGKLDGMSKVIDELIAAIRRMATDLRPAALEDLGLAPACEALAAEFERRSGVVTEVIARDGDLPIGGAATTALFRIVQESLSNVARHAGARRVQIEVRVDAGHVVVEILDDGRGITPEEARDPRAIGLLGMRERALQLGGTVEIGPGPTGGTRVVASIPAGA